MRARPPSKKQTDTKQTPKPPSKGDLTQAEKFAQAARDLGADQNEDAFKGVLRKLAQAKRDA